MMETRIVNRVVQKVGRCPVPRCQSKEFVGDNEAAVLIAIREHLRKAMMEDDIHADIVDKEGWLDSDPLGD